MKAYLNRVNESDKQTLGYLTLYDGLEKVFDCVTLELPWVANMQNVSCIPKGVYKVVPRCSPKYKNHFILEDVPNRKYILIHTGTIIPTQKGVFLLAIGLHRSTMTPCWILQHLDELSMSYWTPPKDTDLN